MRIFSILFFLILASPCKAMRIKLVIPKDTIIGVQPAPEIFTQYRLSEKKPFPLQKYIIMARVQNPLFRETRENDDVSAKNSLLIDISGQLNLISYNDLTKGYKFEFKLNPKVIFEMPRNIGVSLFKEFQAETLFSFNKKNTLLLNGKFAFRNKELETNSGSNIKLFVDQLHHISMQVVQPIVIFVDLQD